MAITIKRKYEFPMTIAGNNGSPVDYFFETVGNEVDLDHSIIQISIKASSAYSPRYYYTTAKLVDGRTARIHRPFATGGYTIMAIVTVTEFSDEVSVQRGSAHFTTATTSLAINLSPSVDHTKSIPIITVNTITDGQDVGDYLIEARLDDDPNIIILDGGVNGTEKNVEYQVITFNDPSVMVTHLREVITAELQSTLLPSGHLPSNTILCLSSQGNALITHLAQLPVGYISGPNPYYATIRRGRSGDLITAFYVVSFDGINSFTNAAFESVTEIDTGYPINTDPEKIGISFNHNSLYGYLQSPADDWNNDSSHSATTVDTENYTNIRQSRYGSNDAWVAYQYFTLDKTVDSEIFNHLHYIGRGIGVGIGVGIC